MSAVDHQVETQTEIPLEDLDLVELLALIVDVQIPEPISFSPQTAGWLVLLTVSILALVIFGMRYYLGYRRNAYRRQAMVELNSVSSLADIAEQLSTIAAITKRVALVTFERTQVADAYGNHWIEFLNRTCKQSFISSPEADYLTSGPYQKKSSASAEDVDRLLIQIGVWVKEHHA